MSSSVGSDEYLEDPSVDSRKSSIIVVATEFWDDVHMIVTNGTYILIVLGYAAQTFVIGVAAYFGVSYLQHVLGFSVGAAASYFGACTVFTGIVGTWCGGWMLDLMRATIDQHMSGTYKRLLSIQAALKLMTLLTLCALPCVLVAFWFADPIIFFTSFVLGELLMFGCSSPVNSVVIWAVPFRLSPLAISLSIVTIHLFGDASSPVIFGAVLDATHGDWQATMFGHGLWLVWSVVFWAWGWWKVSRQTKLALQQYHIHRAQQLAFATHDREGGDYRHSYTPHHLHHHRDHLLHHNHHRRSQSR